MRYFANSDSADLLDQSNTFVREMLKFQSTCTCCKSAMVWLEPVRCNN